MAIAEYLVESVRQDLGVTAATLSDYDNPTILRCLTDVLTTRFERGVVNSTGGYWTQRALYTTVGGVSRYELPPRSCRLMKVELRRSGKYLPLGYLTYDQFQESDQQGTPSEYTIEGDQLVPVPCPSAAETLRLRYRIKPSRLVKSQVGLTAAPYGGDIDRGRITAFNPVARTITVNAVPYDQLIASPAAITTAVQRIDVVSCGSAWTAGEPSGWHELHLVSAPQTLSGLVFTITDASLDMSLVKVGDYLRVAGQSEFAPIPDDYQQALTKLTASEIAARVGRPDRQQELIAEAADVLQRFSDVLSPQVSGDPPTIQNPWARSAGPRFRMI